MADQEQPAFITMSLRLLAIIWASRTRSSACFLARSASARAAAPGFVAA